MTNNDIRSITDDYDLTAMIGKYMNDKNVSYEIKDAIKIVAQECFKIGLEIGRKEHRKVR